MRVFVLGKPREVTHWTEDCVAGFQAAGHDVALGVTRDARLHPGLERLLMARWAGGLPVRRLVRAIADFRPDLILAVRGFATPEPILDAVAAMPARPPLAGWVGDAFTDADRRIADRFDLVAYTDTGMRARHRELGFRAADLYLPHAANQRLLPPTAHADEPGRARGVVFVANPTPRRRAILAAMARPVFLFGPGWTQVPGQVRTQVPGQVPGGPHVIEARGVGVSELGRLYATSVAVLNIHHEANVASGLNQRHFDPPLCGTPVLSDAQADLPLCFEPGQEVLVWSETADLNALHERVLREPSWARTVGERARRRVGAEHLYGHRLETLRRAL